MEELRGKSAIGTTINYIDLKVIRNILVLCFGYPNENVIFQGNQVTKNLGLSALLMTYLPAAVVRVEPFYSPITPLLSQVSTVVRAAVFRPQAVEFSLLPLCLASTRAEPGCAASLPTGFSWLLTNLHRSSVLAVRRRVESAAKER